ncbi:unnamed protein product [Haemonchus placei]|uniref:C2H2-type domain-containing protein n=1 Tax=Haemonchus placei TaxID=6290 RepID=A0A3P7VDR5_HAEPC|nr:unnamed protein product [Haemonchus placei]
MTSFGLERHASEKHQDHLQEILEHIETISAEWRRREEELARRRDRMYSTRLRQENIAQGVSVDADGNVDATEAVKEQHFKSCSLCGMIIDADSPSAMENHLRAHKRNDDLKLKLLARYGYPEIISSIMIYSFIFLEIKTLNFPFHPWLLLTNFNNCRYVCKWCGHVAYTMTELNMHKADVHAMPPFTVKSDRERVMYCLSHVVVPLFIYRTTCEQCGLRLVRPSLLVRHMLRVHSKNVFSCEIETPGSCNYRIDVDCERITWICCEIQYSTR